MDEYEKEVEGWITFFKCKTEEEVEELKLQTKNPGIKEAIKELMTVNASSIWRARSEARLKARRDRVAREEFLIDKGISQGISQGMAQEVFTSVYEKDYSMERGAEKLNLTEKEFEEKYAAWLEKK